MDDKIEMRAGDSSSFELVLSTWFIMYLHGDRPGGLPQDFLTRGSSSLLLFDKIYCDKDALDAEERSKAWLSSALYVALKQEGILEPINMREYLPQEFFDHLRDTGMIQAVLKAMEIELSAIKKGEKKPNQLKLLPILTWLNHYMFMGVEIPNSLNYEWQEHHFKVPPTRIPLHQKSILTAKTDEKIIRDQRLISVLRGLLPEFSLLPSIPPRSRAAGALRRNITREKPPLYRWIYGDPDMPRDKYHELRLGPDFRIDDTKIDEPRKAETWRNFELLMKARKATKDVRTGVKKIITDVVNGQRSITDVKRELTEHQKEIFSYLGSPSSIKTDVALSGVGFAVSVAETIGALAGLIPGISPIGPGMAAFGIWQTRAKRQKYRALRQRYPLAWFLRDFKEIQDAERLKLIPRSCRK